ncbi:MAG: 30S ribosomal protein S2 [Candidatus Omnitrophica bacterium]|nr:30S ribosomal protein S2 [Candidatus Omnitrophota bacterium]
MSVPTIIKDLLERGVHFGHLSKHWDPKMKKFIFGKKKNLYIIDLQKTAGKLEEAKDFVRKVALKGGCILFVATKKHFKDTIEKLASSCGMPYLVERWIGGFLTNFVTVNSRIKKYVQLKEKREKGELDNLPTKELLRLNRELDKMHRNYRGVVSLDKLPDCLYIVDTKRESAAVREAKKLNIPIVAIVDTDSDPDIIDYPIPGNDDAIKSVGFLTSCIVEAINQGLEEGGYKKKETKIEEVRENSLQEEETKQ